MDSIRTSSLGVYVGATLDLHGILEVDNKTICLVYDKYVVCTCLVTDWCVVYINMASDRCVVYKYLTSNSCMVCICGISYVR